MASKKNAIAVDVINGNKKTQKAVKPDTTEHTKSVAQGSVASKIVCKGMLISRMVARLSDYRQNSELMLGI